MGQSGVFVITLSGVYLLNLPYKDLSALVVLFVVLVGGSLLKTYWRSIFRPWTR